MVDTVASYSSAARPASRAGWLDATCATIFALFILGVAIVALLAPERDWDLAAYVALSIEDRAAEPQALHEETWRIVAENTTGEEFLILTEAGKYRQAQYASAENFVSQLPMYRLKVGYIALIKALAPSVGPVMAIHVINAAAVLLLGATLLVAFWRADLLHGLVFLAPLMLLSGFVYMARLATPDMLAAALTVLGTVLLCSRGGRWLAVPMLVAAFLVRPDTIVFLFALVLAALVFGWRRMPVLATFAIAAVLSVILTSGPDHMGWWPHFWFSTIAMQPDMSGFDPDFSFAVYLQGLAGGLAIALIKYHWLALGTLLLLGAWLVSRDGREVPTHVAAPMLAALLAVGGKFVAFPIPYDRFYAPYLWVLAIGLLMLWRPQLLPAPALSRNSPH